MGEKRVFIGLLFLGLFGCLCEAQQEHESGFATTRWFHRKPVVTLAPSTARTTYKNPWYSWTPATTRPTQPTLGRPSSTRPQATSRPTLGRPSSTRPLPTSRPTLGKPHVTQSIITPRPSIGEPTVTIPVETPTPKPDAVKARCGESSVQLEVDMDLLGIGHLIQPSDITLGGCGFDEQDESKQVLLLETELHSCGSVLAMTADSLIYTFSLNYQPTALGSTPIVRTSGAVVGIQCHYMRLHNVSSNALKPTWIPYHSTLSAEDILVFSLRLMTENWQVARASNVFFLGDLINIEASVVQANHVPLRVFVDYCVATLEPDMNAVPRYAFIENEGCLVDSKLTNSRSQFLSRVQDDKLQFQLDAFRFAQEARSAIYIFCHLKATAALPDSEGRACSFPLGKERWISASGNDEACTSCDSSGGVRKGRSVDSGTQYESIVALDPIVIQDIAQDVVPGDVDTLKADHGAQGASEAVIMAGVVAAVGLACMIVLGAVLAWKHYKPAVL